MPLHSTLLAGAATGGVPIPPISAWGGTSGDAFSESGAVNIGGLFGSSGGVRSASSNSMLPVIIIGGMILLAGLFLFRRRR